MTNKMLITCFTDLKDSTSNAEQLGHDEFLPRLFEYLRVGKTISSLCGGRYIKNIGDAHMVTFEILESAVQFAIQIQQLSTTQISLNRLPIYVRVSLFLGVVEPTDDDVFGSGVNQAARVIGKVEPGQVVVNHLLFEQIKRVWGAQRAEKYFLSKGKLKLKGIKDPPRQELFSFNWNQYGQDNPDDSISRLVHDHLQQASVEASNLSVGEISNPGLVIWPVVPRNLATAIHRGQAEIIRLLALLGWKVKLLVADCGAKPFKRDYCDQFCHRLIKYLEKREVGPIDVIRMSELYEPNFRDYSELQLILKRIAADLSVEDMLAINNKKYSNDVQGKIGRKPYLDFSRPALTTAAVLYLVREEHKKCIVVAGADERIQWERTFRFSGTRPQLGVLMNPILKIDEIHQSLQESDWPIWDSPQAIVRETEATNLGSWVFRLHLFLPAFPSNAIDFNGTLVSPTSWGDEMGFPPGVQKEELAKRVWKLLDPAI